MQSREYRHNIKVIIRNVMRKKFPGLKQSQLTDAGQEIAAAIHARFYGAAVDGVASPIWRDDSKYVQAFSDAQPTKTAQEILNEVGNGK